MSSVSLSISQRLQKITNEEYTQRQLEILKDIELPNDILTIPTETEKQKDWIFARDHDLVDWFSARNEIPEITHIISPRAILWGILHIIASHGGDYFSSLPIPPEMITEYTQIPDEFFINFLHLIRKSTTKNTDEFYHFVNLSNQDSKIKILLAYYGNFIRMLVTDPRNMIVTSQKYNDSYTPLRSIARRKYPIEKSFSFVQMNKEHEVLGRSGLIHLLISPKAEDLQQKAIERTKRLSLSQYPNTWKREKNEQFMYENILHSVVILNNFECIDP